MTDIVRDPYGNPLKRDATITTLRAENEKLRAALRDIAKVTRGWEPGVWTEEEGRKYFSSLFFGAQEKARAALSASQPAPRKEGE